MDQEEIFKDIADFVEENGLLDDTLEIANQISGVGDQNKEVSGDGQIDNFNLEEFMNPTEGKIYIIRFQ